MCNLHANYNTWMIKPIITKTYEVFSKNNYSQANTKVSLSKGKSVFT